jgi:hypothetical protein
LLDTAGGIMGILCGIFCCFAFAHLIHWSTSASGTDPAWLPLWACYAIVGLVLGVAAGALLWTGERKRQSIHPLQSTAGEALKENVEWATHPTRPPNRH